MQVIAVVRDSITRNLKVIKIVSLLIMGILVLALGSHLLVYGDDKRTLAVGIVVLVLPMLLYTAVVRPFLFPLGLYVLLVPFDNLLSLDPRYGTVTKLVAICAGLALVFALVRNRRWVPPHRAVWLWLGLLVWMALSVFWALDSVEATTRLITYAELMVLYLVIAMMPLTPTDFKLFSITVILGAFVASFYAVHLFHSGINVQNATIDQQVASRVFVRVGESHIDPNAFAAALLLPIALMMTFILQRQWSVTKLALIGVLLVLLGGIYVSASRGAELAIGMMMIYLLIRGRHRAQVLLFCVVGLGTTLILTNPFARFGDAMKTGGAGRLSIWKVGFEAFKNHWLVGAGVGNFPVAYDKAYIFIYQNYIAGWHRASHNVFLGLAVELGIIGLALGLIAWYQQWRMLSFITKSEPLYDLRIALESTILGLFVASLFLPSLPDKYIWLAFGFMAAARSLALNSSHSVYAVLPPVRLAKLPDENLFPSVHQKVRNHA